MEEEGSKSKKKVMVAIDESECSHDALEWALRNLQESLVNSELIVFTAQPISDYSYLYASSVGNAPCSSYGGIPFAAPELIKNFQEQRQKFAEDLLAKAKEICDKLGISAKTMTEVGEPKQTICEAVEKHNVQLLVLGTHGKGVLERTFLGSVSNYCVHNAKCPVLVVRKTD
ncbi:OLC1v1032259C1 [Oldenlandia corymbosa var. corymbosa]|uniref:OLC1v1032259C1 n=1 Tax=Oldenlandia corymbosa var. corymbosa TaxID=529605 RepID=A0AAV1CN86_OLDCO|nr:OLC1v1032259C1 [Oldenlandia corymbosa var. corymbosa]